MWESWSVRWSWRRGKISSPDILLLKLSVPVVILSSDRLLATKSATHLFVMELKDDCFVDSRKKASISRFINHSCEPNCTIEVWTVKRRLRAAIFALEDIPQGAELTFDYQWAPAEGRQPTR